MNKQTSYTSTPKVGTNSASSQDETSNTSNAKRMRSDKDGDEEQFVSYLNNTRNI